MPETDTDTGPDTDTDTGPGRSIATRDVRSADGLRLRVHEHSPSGPDRPTLVLVHGFPDNQGLWDPMVGALAGSGMHVVTYDVRGAGGSQVPGSLSGYRSEHLVDDLVAVLDAVLPRGTRAHLVGHDWGSVQLWDAVAAESTDPRLHGRLASFTSVSGPSLDHSAWLARHPSGRRLALLRQGLHSWYVAAFWVPVLPELAWRGLGGPLRHLAARVEGCDHWGPALPSDAAHGVNLYRANVPRRMARTRPAAVEVPVLVVQPRHDRYVTGVLSEDLDRWCADVRLVEVDAGHWLPRTHPETLARLVAEHVRAHP